jgi:hypothetical protein
MVTSLEDIHRDFQAAEVFDWGLFCRSSARWVYTAGSPERLDTLLEGIDDFPAKSLILVMPTRARLIAGSCSDSRVKTQVIDALTDLAMEQLNRPFPEIVTAQGVGMVLEVTASSGDEDLHWAFRGSPVCRVGSLAGMLDHARGG